MTGQTTTKTWADVLCFYSSAHFQEKAEGEGLLQPPLFIHQPSLSDDWATGRLFLFYGVFLEGGWGGRFCFHSVIKEVRGGSRVQQNFVPDFWSSHNHMAASVCHNQDPMRTELSDDHVFVELLVIWPLQLFLLTCVPQKWRCFLFICLFLSSLSHIFVITVWKCNKINKVSFYIICVSFGVCFNFVKTNKCFKDKFLAFEHQSKQ